MRNSCCSATDRTRNTIKDWPDNNRNRRKAVSRHEPGASLGKAVNCDDFGITDALELDRRVAARSALLLLDNELDQTLHRHRNGREREQPLQRDVKRIKHGSQCWWWCHCR